MNFTEGLYNSLGICMWLLMSEYLLKCWGSKLIKQFNNSSLAFQNFFAYIKNNRMHVWTQIHIHMHAHHTNTHTNKHTHTHKWVLTSFHSLSLDDSYSTVAIGNRASHTIPSPVVDNRQVDQTTLELCHQNSYY